MAVGLPKTFMKCGAVISAIALLVSVLVASAGAHVGADVRPPITSRPDLLNARITNLADHIVTYCFDESVVVDDTSDPGLFSLEGYENEDEDRGDLAQLASDNKCVEVDFDLDEFELHLRIDNYTQACVAEAATTGSGGSPTDENTENCVTLTGSTAGGGMGITDGPDLQSAAIVSSSDRTIRYTFDEHIDCSFVDPELFGFYEGSGSPSRSNGFNLTQDCDDFDDPARTDITIEFFDDVDNAVRFFVEEGALCDAKSECAVNPLRGVSGTTSSPDLIDCDRVSSNEWDYRFDEALTESFDLAAIWLYGDSRDFAENPNTVARRPDGVTVRATFGHDHTLDGAEDDELPLCSVDEGAVQAGGGDDNTIGHIGVANSQERPGHSSGPDLEDVFIDEPGLKVRYIYDEDLDPDEPVDCSDAYVIDAGGTRTDGTGGGLPTGNTMTCDFASGPLASAVGAGVYDEAAAFDEGRANNNQMAAIARQQPGATTTTTTTTATATTTTTTTTTTTPSAPPGKKERIPTTLTIRYDRNRNRFKGAALSVRKACRRDRLVRVRRHRRGPNPVVGTEITNRKGKWSLRRRPRRGRFYALTPRKLFTYPDGTTVICQTDRAPTIRINLRRHAS
jgi:hypothetical protein